MFQQPVSAYDAPLDDELFGTISTLVNHIADELDHPEIWKILADAGAQEGADRLVAAVADVRARQDDPFLLKLIDTLAGVLHAVAIDKASGLAQLHALAHDHAHCPLVAGALFFVGRHGTDRSADLSTKFCDAPFIKFETLFDGSVAPCCSIWTQKRLGRLDDQGFEEIWNGPDAQQMRESIHDGSYRYCNKQRCTLILEDSLPERDAVTDPDLRDAIDHERLVMKSPKWLFLAHDITCNLACPSCRSELLGSDEAQEARFATIENSVFHPLLNADGEVLISISGQGDPWSSQHYRSILRYMADHDLNAKLDIHTNALLMSERKWAEYQGLERYDTLVNVSIDACSAHVYKSVRRPGKWERLEPNLRFIAAKRAAGTFREFHINATIQLDNYHEMPGLVDYAETIGADSVRLYMMQNTGGHIAAGYARGNVADAEHPLHVAFLETLRDPRLGQANAHLYDVAIWRETALAATLPSDVLPNDPAAYGSAIATLEARGEHGTIVSLAVAAARSFAGAAHWLRIEARALAALGFAEQADYRLRDAEAIERQHDIAA